MHFDIVGICLDDNVDLMQLAIKQDDLHWDYHYCDIEGWEGKYVNAFQVKKIPESFLIGNGKFVGKDLFGKELDNALDSLLAVSN